MAGLTVVEVPSDARGNVDLETLKAQLDDTVCGLMITNPNTLGMFEEHIEEVCQLVHAAGGLVYGDGANMNALLGIAKPGEIGFDVIHYNLHKTFSTPTVAAAQAAGQWRCAKTLWSFCPARLCAKYRAKMVMRITSGLCQPRASAACVRSRVTLGCMCAPTPTFVCMARMACAPISQNAVLNANYVQARIHGIYPLPNGERFCMHEVCAQGKIEGAPSIVALDISKRLMDYGFHPPTNYFPLPKIVPESLLIEPTETESLQTLDQFCDAILAIAEEARTQPSY